MAKTNTGLVKYAKTQLGKPYWYGTFGQAANKSVYDQKKKQYPEYYKWVYTPEVAGQKVHDCVGLIKGYLWCDSETDATPNYNGMQDLSANMMLAACKVQGPMSNMPDIPGILVFMNHHVGVYIGNGEVIEARGHAYGVVKTKLNGRGWITWGKCPYISYGETEKKEETKQPVKSTTKVNVELDLVRLGAKGAQVETLQILLKAKGYKGKDGKALTIDGDFGGNTDYALRKFQEAKGLQVDAACGKNTWNKILKG